MTDSKSVLDAIVIGGGFYGVVIAAYLARVRQLSQVVLIEQAPQLMTRASYHNQARVHNGYHYPRSFTTAYRSRINLPRFVQQWPEAVYQNFTKLYAIARHHSKVTVRQFERFCQEIGASLLPADPALQSLFNPRLIEGVFLVEEYAFDASRLAQWAERELASCHIPVYYNTRVTDISRGDNHTLMVKVHSQPDQQTAQFQCRRVFNCTYSGLNQFGGDYSSTQTSLKHEITELALVEPPPVLKDIGITVMDGPFFSMMPFPAKGLHTLSHVRYTPHLSWSDEPGIDPYQRLADYSRQSRVEWMIRDASRFIPAIAQAEFCSSLFEIKSVLVKNETDDGRPILYEKSLEIPGLVSILGGKIDNIFDILARIEEESLN